MLERRGETGRAGPERALITGTGLLLWSFLLPLLLVEDVAPRAPALPSEPPAGEMASPAPTPCAGWDEAESLVLLRQDGETVQLSMAEYLRGVVCAEMPAAFHPEALKAQAVAARTYCLYRRGQGSDRHPQADVCADSTCCQAWLCDSEAALKWGEEAERYAAKVAQAVADTDGLVCRYQGELIDAVFFSSAEGRTSSARTVWGKDVPYLASVESPEGEEVPGLHTLTAFSPDEFAGRFLTAYPEAALDGPPESWFGPRETDEAGAVTAISVGGLTVSGGELRNLYGLRSARFTVEAGENIVFSVTGYGHGVGMSQYGANALAGEGKTFDKILTWYYTGVTVSGPEQPMSQGLWPT